MITSASFNNCTSYPGWYTPSSEVKNMLGKLDHVRRDKRNRLPVKLNEFEHHYKIVAPVSWASKSDIVVYVHQGLLMIAVRKRIDPKNSKRDAEPHSGYFLGVISLPRNADVEFSSAECKQGRLEICLSKMASQRGSVDHQIIVY
ncbi:MAG TPA: Hsp20/alpha crystallin family protein [Chitinophagaceae bacterium]|nr:Hsp20/alpha crystallin family protein [Chitinophagaceae bacterium]